MLREMAVACLVSSFVAKVFVTSLFACGSFMKTLMSRLCGTNFALLTTVQALWIPCLVMHHCQGKLWWNNWLYRLYHSPLFNYFLKMYLEIWNVWKFKICASAEWRNKCCCNIYVPISFQDNFHPFCSTKLVLLLGKKLYKLSKWSRRPTVTTCCVTCSTLMLSKLKSPTYIAGKRERKSSIITPTKRYYFLTTFALPVYRRLVKK